MKQLLSYLNRIRYKLRVYLQFFGYKAAPNKKKAIINNFHRLYYDSNILGNTWNNTFFLGTITQKCPLDLFIYQEILYEVKPDVIVESGTAYGGGALYLASICELMNHGTVVTIDVAKYGNPPKNKRIEYLRGSSIDPKIVDKVKKVIKNKKKVLVILDSDHSRDHVLKEMEIYHTFVTKGSYLIVEDSNVNGHPVQPEHGPGPMEAIQSFLKKNHSFTIDLSREKFYLTFNPNGYLKKIR